MEGKISGRWNVLICLNCLENVALPDTTPELFFWYMAKHFPVPPQSYIESVFLETVPSSIHHEVTRILVSTVGAIFVFQFFQAAMMNESKVEKNFGQKNEQNISEWNIGWKTGYHVKCAQCLIKCERSAKRRRSAFFIFQIFSAFSQSLSSLLQFEICQIEIGIELLIVSHFQSAEVQYFHSFWLTNSRRRKKREICKIWPWWACTSIFKILKSSIWNKFGNISSDAWVDKNPSWLILTARSNTERNLSELEFEVIFICWQNLLKFLNYGKISTRSSFP